MSRMRRTPTVLSVVEREALTFACPWCHVGPGAWCLTEVGQPAPQMHALRIELGEDR